MSPWPRRDILFLPPKHPLCPGTHPRPTPYIQHSHPAGREVTLWPRISREAQPGTCELCPAPILWCLAALIPNTLTLQPEYNLTIGLSSGCWHYYSWPPWWRPRTGTPPQGPSVCPTLRTVPTGSNTQSLAATATSSAGSTN